MDISKFTPEQIQKALHRINKQKQYDHAKYERTADVRKEYAAVYYENNKEKVLEQQRKRRAAKKAAAAAAAAEAAQ
jgi:ferric-dicitrate binding protein FerR (iron transport regulator)